MRYIGIDYGSKRIGVALSDEAGTMGFPHTIMDTAPRAVDDLVELIAREQVGAIVLGESRTLAGEENPIMKDARVFGEVLQKRTGLPLHLESEVFTSEEARQMHEPEERSRSPKVRTAIDDSAAALILTSYLSRNHE